LAALLASARQQDATVGVLTVDDQPVFRVAAVAVIEATPGFTAVGQAGSGEEALRLSEDLRPDLVLMDIRMPGMDGIEAARRLSSAVPDAVVVLISLEDAADFWDLARNAGAAAFVRKQDLCPALLARLWSEYHRH
jgi:two-component system, NarL family, invasion response regulator UvrY